MKRKMKAKIIKLALILLSVIIIFRWWKNKQKQKEEKEEKALNGYLNGFFVTDTIKSLDDLKKQYYKLAKTYHPDAGGSDVQMQQLNEEYDKLRKKIKQGANLNQEHSQFEDELDKVYKDIIAKLVNLPNIDIEIIGSWVWISGATYPIKDVLKDLAFKFSRKKKMWYWHPEGYVKKSRKEFQIDEIRKMFDVKNVKKEYSKQLNGLHHDISYLQGLLNFR